MLIPTIKGLVSNLNQKIFNPKFQNMALWTSIFTIVISKFYILSSIVSFHFSLGPVYSVMAELYRVDCVISPSIIVFSCYLDILYCLTICFHYSYITPIVLY